MKHRRLGPPIGPGTTWADVDPISNAKCRCEKPGYCPRHDPLTYSGDARHLKGL